MKAKIFGFATAILLLGGSFGFAAGTSLVGSKVTGTYSIEQDGKKIADAAIINGSAYVPVRIMADATGTELEVKGKTITMKTEIVEPETTSTSPAVVKPNELALKERLSSLENRVTTLNQAITQAESDISTLSSTDQEARKKYINDLKSRVTLTMLEISEVKAQLGE
ncbi:hypothetical protein [Paenibacillus sp. P46E]|uniref:hypothetical protein n=1 Tax=Paenibacillus sp. P46E TaxID=1349436 RepID=UPI00093C78A4|nr:hypothetical protein [Paenibacillus sp. P46E]OKP95377.1 hypothetical protein A3849_26190 [Paenibacillus sp. P46E]